MFEHLNNLVFRTVTGLHKKCRPDIPETWWEKLPLPEMLMWLSLVRGQRSTSVWPVEDILLEFKGMNSLSLSAKYDKKPHKCHTLKNEVMRFYIQVVKGSKVNLFWLLFNTIIQSRTEEDSVIQSDTELLTLILLVHLGAELIVKIFSAGLNSFFTATSISDALFVTALWCCWFRLISLTAYRTFYEITDMGVNCATHNSC